MVKFLIKIVGAAIARQIERGSMLGAWVGALVGVAVGLGSACGISMAFSLEGYRIAVYLIFGIPACIAGAMAGASLGPRRIDTIASDKLRLTNINAAAGFLLITIILGAALFLAVQSMHEPAKAGDIDPKYDPYITVGVGLLFGISLFVATRVTWYMDLGEQFAGRRLLTKRVYDWRSLQMWNFEDGHGGILKQPTSDATLHLRFDDGRRYKVKIAVEHWQNIAEILTRSAPSVAR